ncbi:hypothetical protein [Paracoccus pacificus]|uniref:Yip1 domain-containing protein n=1 Tax=Paracoccus pacificus TaxID=1463598 RepID=A0ABW4R4G9_9RHOB
MAASGNSASADRSIVLRVLRTWVQPARVLRGIARQGVSEAGLIVMLIGALAVLLVAQLPMHARAAQLDPAVPFQARLGGALVAVMFMMPLIAYAVAWLAGVIMRLAGRPITGLSSRLALFWALLAVSPAMLLSGLLAGLVGPSLGLTVTNIICGVAFATFWITGLCVLSAPKQVAP